VLLLALRKEKISRKASYELIMMMAKHSNNYVDIHHKINLQTDDDVKRFFSARTGTFDELVEFCRDYKEPVPIVENLIGSLFVTNGTAIITSTYHNLYESASKHLNEAIKNVSYSDLQSAITSGIASIEAYINRQVEIWNELNPNDQLIDSRNQKVSFDDKVEKWIPKIAGGKKLDKGLKPWPDFKRLRGIRDNVTIHPKESSFTKSVYEIAEGINMFRTGITGLLIQLHGLFGAKIPAIIIRNCFAPDVEVVETGL
jgi:hypothetical protein